MQWRWFYVCLKPPADVWHIKFYLMEIHTQWTRITMTNNVMWSLKQNNQIHDVRTVRSIQIVVAPSRTHTTTDQTIQNYYLLREKKKTKCTHRHTLTHTQTHLQANAHLCLRINCQHLNWDYFSKDTQIFMRWNSFQLWVVCVLFPDLLSIHHLYHFNGSCCWFVCFFLLFFQLY